MSSKVSVIKVETTAVAEQQENLKNIRRGAKVLQKPSQDKENLLVRKPFGGLHKGFIRSKSANELSDGEIKRKKLASHSVQTGSQTALAHIDEEQATSAADVHRQSPVHQQQIEDAVQPLSEHYWRDQAEAHRQELEQHLQHNEKLHIAVQQLRLRLKNANEQLDDSKELVEVLTEMLEEDETGAEPAVAASNMEVVSGDEVESSTAEGSNPAAETNINL